MSLLLHLVLSLVVVVVVVVVDDVVVVVLDAVVGVGDAVFVAVAGSFCF